MFDKISSVTGQIWDDLVKSCKLFTSACGVVGTGIALVNAVKGNTLAPLSFTDKPTHKNPV